MYIYINLYKTTVVQRKTHTYIYIYTAQTKVEMKGADRYKHIISRVVMRIKKWGLGYNCDE